MFRLKTVCFCGINGIFDRIIWSQNATLYHIYFVAILRNQKMSFILVTSQQAILEQRDCYQETHIHRLIRINVLVEDHLVLSSED